MTRVPELREVPDLPEEVKNAALDGDLVLFVGAGTSMLLGMPSWGGMAKQQMEHLREKGALNYSELEQLSSLDPKKQLSIAMQIAKDNEIPLDLTEGLTGFSEGNSIYKSINDIGCVCVTTNYDELLAPRYTDTENGSATPATVNRIYKKDKLLMMHLDTPGTVIHLHGAVSDESTMVVTTRDYLEHYDARLVQDFLGDLFARKTVLFIGYGLEEAEVLEHILRRGGVGKNKERKRFVLQGYYLIQKPLYENLHSYYRKSFGVHVIGFVRDHKDYKQQEAIFDDWDLQRFVNRPPLAADMEKMNQVSGDGGELGPAELDLLARIATKEELRPFFFRKKKGLMWFDALDERKYFDPAGNLAPVPAQEEGYVSVPHWPVTNYLVATSPELLVEENRRYAERVLKIIRMVTNAAREREFGNYRTWWQFSKIIQNIPVGLITSEDMGNVDYWLDAPYGDSLVASELGGEWLVALLGQASDEAKTVALELLKVLYKAAFPAETQSGSEPQKAALRFDKQHAEKITKAVAGKSGQVLGQPAVQVFESELQRVLEAVGNGEGLSLWRAAIEDHEQNRSVDGVEDILVVGLRDSLGAWVQEAPEDAATFVADLLDSPLQIFKRVGIYTIGQNYQSLIELIDSVIIEEHFESGFRHEMWHVLHDRYPLFPEPTKQRVQDIIEQIATQDAEGNPNPKAVAYKQAIWLSAIKNHTNSLQERYRECSDVAGAEPDHPAFPIYSYGGTAQYVSPVPREELLEMGIDELIGYLDQYEDPGPFQEPGLEGLVEALKIAVKSAPLHFVPGLEKFADLDSAYVYVLIEAFSELWTEKRELPWDDVWQSLLNFCEAVIRRNEFWSPENSEQRAHFVANRYWVVGSIGRLIEAGTRSDEHAFSPMLLDQAKRLLLTLLERESGGEFKPDSDAVIIAVGSPRGQCLNALINLALRSCRLAGKDGDGHVDVWNDLQPIFEEELAKADAGEYEFITLLVYCLPNFLYMSEKWVSDNLARIFDRNNYQKWLCAMQAYAYVNQVYKQIYNHLKENQHFIDALDDKNLKDSLSERIIQNIVVAYLNDDESLEDSTSLIRQLLDRAKDDELRQLIWFIWTLRMEDGQNLYNKVMELWPRLLQAIDTSSLEGRKLASRLTTWSVFITEVDDTNRDLILQVAEFADEDYNSHDLLEWIARISEEQPQEAVTIWQELLKGPAPDYPEAAIRKAFDNIVASGDEGRRDALAIVGEYIKQGKETPHLWLQEIQGQ